MLCLARKPDPDKNIIKIGDDIVITIHRIEGKQVTVGVDAPKHIRIARGELKSLDTSEDAGVGS